MTNLKKATRLGVASMVALGTIVGAAQAQAVNDGVDFNVDVPETCALTVLSDGTLGVANASITELNSRTAGTAGAVEVTTNAGAPGVGGPGNSVRGYQITVDNAVNWVGPQVADVLTPEFDVYGTTNNQAGTAVQLTRRETQVAVHLTAESTSGPFQAGTYTGTVTITCEPV